MPRINLNINPQILQWSRQEAGYEIEEVAKKLSIDSKQYLDWESNGKEIPFGKLQDLADYYKRQLAVFFLPEVPEKLKRPKDFRNLSTIDKKLSKEVLLPLRRSAYYQSIACDLEGEQFWNNKLNWLNEIEQLSNEHEIIKYLRNLLGVTIDDQLGWKNEMEAYKKWRSKVEEHLGILVFQFSMPMEEIQGFCLTEKLPYVIITNSNHTYSGRLFTIFHELAHIIRHESGMCLIDKIEKNQAEEWECNKMAASFLLPRDTVVPVENLNDLKNFARKLKVSREVYLRRLLEEKLISKVKFYSFLESIKATYPKQRKKGKVIVLPEIKSKASRGETFYNLVFEALDKNRINYTDAAQFLGLRLNRLVNEI